MAAQPARTLVAALDHERALRFDQISAENIARIVRRIAPRERQETTIDIAAFNSSI